MDSFGTALSKLTISDNNNFSSAVSLSLVVQSLGGVTGDMLSGTHVFFLLSYEYT